MSLLKIAKQKKEAVAIKQQTLNNFKDALKGSLGDRGVEALYGLGVLGVPSAILINANRPFLEGVSKGDQDLATGLALGAGTSVGLGRIAPVAKAIKGVIKHRKFLNDKIKETGIIPMEKIKNIVPSSSSKRIGDKVKGQFDRPEVINRPMTENSVLDDFVREFTPHQFGLWGMDTDSLNLMGQIKHDEILRSFQRKLMNTFKK